MTDTETDAAFLKRMVGLDDLGDMNGKDFDRFFALATRGAAIPDDGSCIKCGSVPRNSEGLCVACLEDEALKEPRNG